MFCWIAFANDSTLPSTIIILNNAFHIKRLCMLARTAFARNNATGCLPSNCYLPFPQYWLHIFLSLYFSFSFSSPSWWYFSWHIAFLLIMFQWVALKSRYSRLIFIPFILIPGYSWRWWGYNISMPHFWRWFGNSVGGTPLCSKWRGWIDSVCFLTSDLTIRNKNQRTLICETSWLV